MEVRHAGQVCWFGIEFKNMRQRLTAWFRVLQRVGVAAVFLLTLPIVRSIA